MGGMLRARGSFLSSFQFPPLLTLQLCMVTNGCEDILVHTSVRHLLLSKPAD